VPREQRDDGANEAKNQAEGVCGAFSRIAKEAGNDSANDGTARSNKNHPNVAPHSCKRFRI